MPTYYSFNFTIAEANQLAAYVESRDEGNHAGWYYGDPDKFQSRHRRILEELELRREIRRAAQETSAALEKPPLSKQYEGRSHRGIARDWHYPCTDNDCWCWGSEHHNPNHTLNR